MNVDWQVAESLIAGISAMAASGVIEKEEIIAAYKEMLRGTGSRVTKKAEKLIDELCHSLPLATRKGNTYLEVCDVEGAESGETGKPEKAESNSRKPETSKKEKDKKEEYTQISIFDL